MHGGVPEECRSLTICTRHNQDNAEMAKTVANAADDEGSEKPCPKSQVNCWSQDASAFEGLFHRGAQYGHYYCKKDALGASSAFGRCSSLAVARSVHAEQI